MVVLEGRNVRRWRLARPRDRHQHEDEHCPRTHGIVPPHVGRGAVRLRRTRRVALSPRHSISLADDARLLGARRACQAQADRSEEHTSELQSLMRISYAVFCLKKKNKTKTTKPQTYINIHHIVK